MNDNNNEFKNFNPSDLDFKESDESTSMLKSIIRKIELLEEQKSNVLNEIKDILNNAKNEGFSYKIIKKILALRKMNPKKIQEEEMLIEHYKKLLGM
jgi:uncharacterized protein (UPF0335 family)